MLTLSDVLRFEAAASAIGAVVGLDVGAAPESFFFGFAVITWKGSYSSSTSSFFLSWVEKS
jgi:hypothetical protein